MADQGNRTNEGFSSSAQREAVRDRYSSIAGQASIAEESGCCGTGEAEQVGRNPRSDGLGYTSEERDAILPGADLGLGCGNPVAISNLKRGETVLDLGSGAGFDCFLAAKEVGAGGRVIGVDMTPEMVEKARANIDKNDANNVEFRLGEIEHLPVADETVDVIISNCVINLSPDKPSVFEEAYRVLRPGGRLAISDVVMTADPPEGLRADPASVSACVGDAATISTLEPMLANAGFADVSLAPIAKSEEFIREWDDELDLSEFLVSATIEGRKPTG